MSADDPSGLDKAAEEFREEIERGNYHVLLGAVLFSLLSDKPFPAWLKSALVEAIIAGHTSKSWDDIFGKPLKKGERLGTRIKRVKLEYPIYKRVEEAKRAGRSVNKGLFEDIGKKLGVSGTVASEIYYESRKQPGGPQQQ